MLTAPQGIVDFVRAHRRVIRSYLEVVNGGNQNRDYAKTQRFIIVVEAFVSAFEADLVPARIRKRRKENLVTTGDIRAKLSNRSRVGTSGITLPQAQLTPLPDSITAFQKESFIVV